MTTSSTPSAPPSPAPQPAKAAFDSHALDEEVVHINPSQLPKPRRWAVALGFVLLAGSLVGLFMLGYLPRRADKASAEEFAHNVATDRPRVRVVRPRLQAATPGIQLPCDLLADASTSLFARTSGFIKTINADIGGRVKADQLLAEIDAPELQAQLRTAEAIVDQRRASLTRAQTELKLAQILLKRQQDASKSSAGTQLELDQRQAESDSRAAQVTQAESDVHAAEREVDRLRELVKFTRIVAPFDGVVTARGYDIGALVSADTTTNRKPLFEISAQQTIRVNIAVPQTAAAGVVVGAKVVVSVSSLPDRTFQGLVSRTAGSINPDSRTLQVQADVPNPDYVLVPGSYARVDLELRPGPPVLRVPSNALQLTPTGNSVLTVVGGVLTRKPVVIGRDFGDELEVREGLSADNLVVTTPGARLTEGVLVDVAESPATKSTSER